MCIWKFFTKKYVAHSCSPATQHDHGHDHCQLKVFWADRTPIIWKLKLRRGRGEATRTLFPVQLFFLFRTVRTPSNSTGRRDDGLADRRVAWKIYFASLCSGEAKGHVLRRDITRHDVFRVQGWCLLLRGVKLRILTTDEDWRLQVICTYNDRYRIVTN